MLRTILLLTTALGWPALAETPVPKPILGTVTEFKVDSLQIGIKPDDGGPTFFRVGPDTEVVQVPPGQRDLTKAAPSTITRMAIGDRILVSFVAGLTDARRIVLVSAREIAQRNESVRLDWQIRGVSGLVTAKTPTSITLDAKNLQGARTLTIALSEKTTLRRYAPDSVKFADAEDGNLADVTVGDQLRARGAKSADGSTIIAEEIVFGTFVTKVGRITGIDSARQEIVLQDLVTKAPVTVKFTADSKLKSMAKARVVTTRAGVPEPQHPDGAAAAVGPTSEMAQVLARLPAATFADLKVGGAVIVSSTRSSQPGRITAIMLIAGADPLVQMAETQAAQRPGTTAADVMGRLHGGAMSGPNGLALPALIP